MRVRPWKNRLNNNTYMRANIIFHCSSISVDLKQCLIRPAHKKYSSQAWMGFEFGSKGAAKPSMIYHPRKKLTRRARIQKITRKLGRLGLVHRIVVPDLNLLKFHVKNWSLNCKSTHLSYSKLALIMSKLKLIKPQKLAIEMTQNSILVHRK